MLSIPLTSAVLEKGTRVGMFASYQVEDNKKTFRFYGWGTYEGDCELGDTNGEVSYQSVNDKQALFEERGKVSAPRLRHDDGTVTWGLIVWWDEEEIIKQYLDQAEVVIDVSLKEAMAVFDAELKNRQSFAETAVDINVLNPDVNKRNLGN